MIFGGGGSRGYAYCGAIKGMKEVKVRESAIEVIGSSAGSMAAMAVACGVSAEKLQAFFADGKIGELGGSLSLQTGGNWGLGKGDAKNIQPYLDAMIKEEILEFARGIEKLPQPPLAVLNVFRKASLENAQITFSDLNELIKVAPKKFKHLSITAVNNDVKRGGLKIFSTYDASNESITATVCASCSAPPTLKPVEINGTNYIDGGVFDNIPMDQVKEKGRMMVFTCDFGIPKEEEKTNHSHDIGEANNAVYTNKPLEKNPADSLLNCLSFCGKDDIPFSNASIKKYQEGREKNYNQMREKALNIVILHTEGNDGTSFKDAQEKLQYLNQRSYVDTLKYCLNHDIGQLNVEQINKLPYLNLAVELHQVASKDPDNQQKAEQRAENFFNDIQGSKNTEEMGLIIKTFLQTTTEKEKEDISNILNNPGRGALLSGVHKNFVGNIPIEMQDNVARFAPDRHKITVEDITNIANKEERFVVQNHNQEINLSI